ncbi:hypothetical protein BD770DRAFT_388901 [Pilaira anomala]|nr:hypothetical protein BD770DRAFT_388901 [Pilaira anomala]
MSQSPHTTTYPSSPSHRKRSRSPSSEQPSLHPTKKRILRDDLPFFSSSSLTRQDSSNGGGGTFNSFCHDESIHWTPKHWKTLEYWYIRKHHDYKLAAEAFYSCESLIQLNPRKELWPIEKILWKAKCLDTSTKAHGGLVPSERKRSRSSMLSTPDLTRTPPSRTPNPTPPPIRTPTRHHRPYYSPA